MRTLCILHFVSAACTGAFTVVATKLIKSAPDLIESFKIDQKLIEFDRKRYKKTKYIDFFD